MICEITPFGLLDKTFEITLYKTLQTLLSTTPSTTQQLGDALFVKKRLSLSSLSYDEETVRERPPFKY
jgi:hypothetical protein